jgi:hypothetical protein
MSLSRRAAAFLATLPRSEFVPAARAAELLEQGSGVRNEQWLSFHERFAGYEERLGEKQRFGESFMRSHGGWTPGKFGSSRIARVFPWCVRMCTPNSTIVYIRMVKFTAAGAAAERLHAMARRL